MTADLQHVDLAFVGGGNMAQALIGGLRAQGVDATRIRVVEPVDATRHALDALGVVTAREPDAAMLHGARLVVLAVKPQTMRDVCAQLRPWLDADAVIVSVAAGIRMADLARWLDTRRIVRTMPNTPALVGAGMAGLAALPEVDAASRALAQALLDGVGRTLWVDDEAMLDAVTAVSGSGPAYVFYFIEALEAAARTLGFDAEAAHLLATTTFTGASRLAATSSEPPALLRERVTSKGGTTHAAITTMERADLAAHIAAAVRAAAQRSRELGDAFGRDAG